MALRECRLSNVALMLLKLIPQTGEIDIIEGVHDNEHNQVTWHTGPSMSSRTIIVL